MIPFEAMDDRNIANCNKIYCMNNCRVFIFYFDRSINSSPILLDYIYNDLTKI